MARKRHYSHHKKAHHGHHLSHAEAEKMVHARERKHHEDPPRKGHSHHLSHKQSEHMLEAKHGHHSEHVVHSHHSAHPRELMTGHYEGHSSRRMQEMHDAGMIHEDSREIANLPQEVMIKPYRYAGSPLPESLDDTIRGIDDQIDADDSQRMRNFNPHKY